MGKHVDTSPEKADRRRLLRAGGAAIAGVVGAGVATSIATPANAAPGDPLTIGETDNDAGTAPTALTSSAPLTDATLTLNNSGTTLDQDTGDLVGHPALRLQPSGGDYVGGPIGSLGTGPDGTLWYTPDALGAEYVRTTFNTTEIFPVTPSRALDTRNDRSNLINTVGQPAPNTNIDATGRLIGGRWIQLDLGAFVNFGTVLFAVINCSASSAAGWAAVAPFPVTAGTPSTSVVSFGAGQSVQSTIVVGIGGNASVVDAISIFANQNVRLIIDITALTVSHPAQINPAILGGLGISAQGLTGPRAALAAKRGLQFKARQAGG